MVDNANVTTAAAAAISPMVDRAGRNHGYLEADAASGLYRFRVVADHQKSLPNAAALRLNTGVSTETPSATTPTPTLPTIIQSNTGTAIEEDDAFPEHRFRRVLINGAFTYDPMWPDRLRGLVGGMTRGAKLEILPERDPAAALCGMADSNVEDGEFELAPLPPVLRPSPSYHRPLSSDDINAEMNLASYFCPAVFFEPEDGTVGVRFVGIRNSRPLGRALERIGITDRLRLRNETVLRGAREASIPQPRSQSQSQPQARPHSKVQPHAGYQRQLGSYPHSWSNSHLHRSYMHGNPIRFASCYYAALYESVLSSRRWSAREGPLRALLLMSDANSDTPSIVRWLVPRATPIVTIAPASGAEATIKGHATNTRKLVESDGFVDITADPHDHRILREVCAIWGPFDVISIDASDATSLGEPLCQIERFEVLWSHVSDDGVVLFERVHHHRRRRHDQDNDDIILNCYEENSVDLLHADDNAKLASSLRNKMYTTTPFGAETTASNPTTKYESLRDYFSQATRHCSNDNIPSSAWTAGSDSTSYIADARLIAHRTADSMAIGIRSIEFARGWIRVDKSEKHHWKLGFPEDPVAATSAALAAEYEADAARRERLKERVTNFRRFLANNALSDESKQDDAAT